MKSNAMVTCEIKQWNNF